MPNAARGFFLSLIGAACGFGVGYLTRPQPTIIFSPSQQQLQEIGTHVLVAMAVGLVIGLVLHLVMPVQKT